MPVYHGAIGTTNSTTHLTTQVVSTYNPIHTAISDPHAVSQPVNQSRSSLSRTIHAPSSTISTTGTRALKSLVSNSALPSTLGLLPWWTFVTGTVPGVGAYSINIASGNFILQSTDMDVPHRDLSFTFTRTYNSQSTHDTQHTDGSAPSRFGNGWTSTIDAHLSVNSSGGISVYDSDGTRWDYTSNGNGGWNAPAGQRAILTYWNGPPL